MTKSHELPLHTIDPLCGEASTEPLMFSVLSAKLQQYIQVCYDQRKLGVVMMANLSSLVALDAVIIQPGKWIWTMFSLDSM